MLAIRTRKQAEKALRRMQPKRAAAIIAELRKVAENPARRDVDVRKLVDRPGYRLRVGDWRAIYTLSADTLAVVWIGPRGEAYKE